jgi:Cdc6-like AAA superfamily ATPase
MSFKGFAQLQQVYTLYEHKEKSELHYEGRMVGRDAELSVLAEFVQPIIRGEFAGALVVWGEPGMGKSRLVNEFLQDLQASSLQEVHIFLAQSDEIVREAFNPFRYWLKS